jgi:hypothetical protein
VFKEGWPSVFPERITVKFPVASQQFAPFQPFGVAPSYVVSNQQDEVTATRLIVYQDSELPPQVVTASPTQVASGWQAIGWERLAQKVPASTQRFEAIPPAGDLV